MSAGAARVLIDVVTVTVVEPVPSRMPAAKIRLLMKTLRLRRAIGRMVLILSGTRLDRLFIGSCQSIQGTSFKVRIDGSTNRREEFIFPEYNGRML